MCKVSSRYLPVTEQMLILSIIWMFFKRIIFRDTDLFKPQITFLTPENLANHIDFLTVIHLGWNYGYQGLKIHQAFNA